MEFQMKFYEKVHYNPGKGEYPKSLVLLGKKIEMIARQEREEIKLVSQIQDNIEFFFLVAQSAAN